MQTFHIPINLDLNRQGSLEGYKPLHSTNEPKFLVNVILCAQPPDPLHHLLEHNTQTLWLVQDIQIRHSDWCEIHTLMQWSDWCEIHTLTRRSDWCEQHTILYANIELFFIKKNNFKSFHEVVDGTCYSHHECFIPYWI